MNEEDWDADISSAPTTATMNYGFNRNDDFSSESPVDSLKPAAIGRGRGKLTSFDQDFNSFKPRSNYGNEGTSNDHNSYKPRNSSGNERGSNGGYSSNKPRSGNCYKCGEEGHISRNCPSGERGAGSRGNHSNFNGGYGDRNSNSGGGYGGKSSSFGGNSNSGSYGDSNFNSDNSYGGKKSFSGGDYGASNSNTNGSFGNSNSYSSGGYGGKNSDFRGNDDKSSGGYGGGKPYSGGGYNGSSSPGKYGNEKKSYNNDRNGDNRGGFGSRGGYKKNDDDDFQSSGFNGGSNGGSGSRGGFNQSSGNAVPKKETYIPPPPPENEDEMFESLQRGINFSKYDAIPVEVSGENPPHPISTFEEAQLTETIAKNVARARYETPTPVQKYSIPIVNGGRDLMACAQTGSGKTAAFLLPVLTTLIRTGIQSSTFEKQTPQAIIVGPTRELVNQIYLEARKFARSTICRPCVAYGGTSVGHQMADINRGCNILIATPGRLMDFVNSGRIGLDNIQFLILDEADRMLDMGFEGEIRKLATAMPSKTERQTLMFSATFPDEIQKLAHDFLKEDFIFLTVGRVGGACADVSQNILQVDQSDKRAKLLELLVDVSETRSRTLVFVETKRSADFLACSLSQSGYPTTSIHGDRLQREREEALRDFKKGDCPILIATSVAARGLDIPKVEHVINYDIPKDIDEYVHRIGRTGRCGNLGRATSFYDQSKDSQIARCLVRVLADSLQEVPSWLEGCADSAISEVFDSSRSSRFGGRDTRTKGRGRGGGGFGNTSSSRATGDYDYNDSGGFDSGPTVYQNTGGGFADDNFGTDECWD